MLIAGIGGGARVSILYSHCTILLDGNQRDECAGLRRMAAREDLRSQYAARYDRFWGRTTRGIGTEPLCGAAAGERSTERINPGFARLAARAARTCRARGRDDRPPSMSSGRSCNLAPPEIGL